MSAQEAINELQHLHISFSVPGRKPCSVDVTIEPDNDPQRNGLDLIGLYDDPAVVKGYPLLHASISSPESRIYASLYGWIQITWTPGEPWVMDLYPPFQDINNPFFTWGAEPTIVDAPGRQGVANYDWSARTFLCYSPDAAMTKRAVPILAFEWGFCIEDYKPCVKKLKELQVSTWNEHLELFRGKFPGWTFDEASK